MFNQTHIHSYKHRTILATHILVILNNFQKKKILSVSYFGKSFNSSREFKNYLKENSINF